MTDKTEREELVKRLQDYVDAYCPDFGYHIQARISISNVKLILAALVAQPQQEQINAEGQAPCSPNPSGHGVASQPAPSAPHAEQTHVSVPVELIKDAVDIYDLMLSCSRTCKPMNHLLTTDGLYALNTADLHVRVRNDGKEYVMEADWAKMCGKLVKALKEVKEDAYMPRTATVSAIGASEGMLRAAKESGHE